MKMTEKQILIELLSGKSLDTSEDVEHVAEYLHRSGVRVPPVVVGTTVSACDNIEIIGNIHDYPELLR